MNGMGEVNGSACGVVVWGGDWGGTIVGVKVNGLSGVLSEGGRRVDIVAELVL